MRRGGFPLGHPSHQSRRDSQLHQVRTIKSWVSLQAPELQLFTSSSLSRMTSSRKTQVPALSKTALPVRISFVWHIPLVQNSSNQPMYRQVPMSSNWAHHRRLPVDLELQTIRVSLDRLLAHRESANDLTPLEVHRHSQQEPAPEILWPQVPPWNHTSQPQPQPASSPLTTGASLLLHPKASATSKTRKMNPVLLCADWRVVTCPAPMEALWRTRTPVSRRLSAQVPLESNTQ